MKEVSLENVSKEFEEATVQNWFYEEGDSVEEGEDLVEILTENGVITIQSPVAGVLAEVYYDEGETVSKDDILCVIDDEAGEEKDSEE